MPETSLYGKNVQAPEKFVKLLADVYSLGQVSFTSHKFFTKAKEYLQDLPASFIAQALYYFRMNAGPHYIIYLFQILLIPKIPRREWGKKFYSSIVKNPGDIIKVFEILLEKNLRSTNAMNRGYAFAFEKFTKEDLSAYLNWDNEVKLVDVVRFIHPKGNEAIKLLITNKLKSTPRPEEPIDKDFINYVTGHLKEEPDKIIQEITKITFD